MVQTKTIQVNNTWYIYRAAASGPDNTNAKFYYYELGLSTTDGEKI